MTEKKILLIEDDPSIARGLVEALKREGYQILWAQEGREGLRLALEEAPNLLLLDLMLPGMDGLEICRQVRKESEVPLIMLTAKSDETDIVVGFELGADDYITKPFSLREVLARIKAVLKRTHREDEPRDEKAFTFGEVTISWEGRELKRGNESHPLSNLELEVLKMLIDREGEAISRFQFLNEIWGYQVYPTTRTIDFHISRLRNKIEENPSHPKHILTVHGVGYKFQRE